MCKCFILFYFFLSSSYSWFAPEFGSPGRRRVRPPVVLLLPSVDPFAWHHDATQVLAPSPARRPARSPLPLFPVSIQTKVGEQDDAGGEGVTMRGEEQAGSPGGDDTTGLGSHTEEMSAQHPWAATRRRESAGRRERTGKRESARGKSRGLPTHPWEKGLEGK